MRSVEFDMIAERLLGKCREVLGKRAAQYASEGRDRLHNFRQIAVRRDTTPEDALCGLMEKQQVALADYVANLTSGVMVELDEVEEKIVDIINYHVLLAALFVERAGWLREGEEKEKANVNTPPDI